MAFEGPSVASKFAPRDHPEWIGKLFLIAPTSYEERQGTNQQTGQPEPYKVVVADVAIVDLIDPATGKPTVILNASIGGKAMVPQLAPKVGTGVAAAGRLAKLPSQGSKDGAYILNDYTPADEPALVAFDATDWRGKLSRPAANPPVAAPTQIPSASYAATTPQPAPVAAPAAAASGPWFGTPEGAQLLGKLVANGVANAAQLDEATAKLIGSGLPG